MATVKKADHRLVQPREEHYKELDGVKYLLGPYSIDQRAAYFESQMSLYLTRHPQRKRSEAKRSAFNKWRTLVFATIGDEYVPITDIKHAQNTVKVFKKDKPVDNPIDETQH